ncbi:hypothetical protein CH63R_04205 [Colletotrichum higginsianum IMI 349063]|uniref:Uncharacterized protein n=1 Tax=Colletotrichum higginsianum (strain IMI 349063) TaxID=759273 RepID=A0A1B7YIK2_COLHI|nr:hypothetical protein CH63R_04205 [Colletotrichum higginsianum IMI 349063]OBR11909.1 hypothetical protein CH63R_04205 [Colletotrichum higginsianum IMI 349063]
MRYLTSRNLPWPMLSNRLTSTAVVSVKSPPRPSSPATRWSRRQTSTRRRPSQLAPPPHQGHSLPASPRPPSTASPARRRSSPSSAPTANVVINGNGVTDAANPVITGAGDGANHQHGGGQTGGGSNPGGNGQNNNPNGAPSGSAGQAPGYGVYGSYGSYGQGASAQPGQSEVIGAPAPGQPGAAGAGGQPGGQPGQSAVPGAP